MKRIKTCMMVLSAVTAMGVAIPVWAAASEQAPGQEEKAATMQPFHGKVTAVDKDEKTLTVGGNTIYLAKDTLITRKDKKIDFSELTVGEEVHGMTRKTFDGKAEAVTIKVGPQTPKE